MSHIPRFVAYAAAFEKAYESDDWSEVATFFAEDAVYEIGTPLLGAERCEGREAILAWFPDVLDRFDRRFGSRELVLLEGPVEDGDEVWIRGKAIYRTEGIPDLELVLKEILRFDGEQIVHLEDQYSPEMVAEVERHAEAHGAKTGIELRAYPKTPDRVRRVNSARDQGAKSQA